MSFLSALAVGSMVASHMSAGKAKTRNRQAGRVGQAIAEMDLRRNSLQMVRQAQLARATGVQSAVSSGTLDSSGQLGQDSGILSTTGENLRHMNESFELQKLQGQFTQSAMNYQQNQQMFGGLAQTALSLKSSGLFGASGDAGISRTTKPTGLSAMNSGFNPVGPGYA